MTYKEIKTEKQRYWYIIEALLLVLAIAYGVTFGFFGLGPALYPFIVFGVVAVAASIVMFTQKHYLTLLLNSVFALVVILHYVYQYMY